MSNARVRDAILSALSIVTHFEHKRTGEEIAPTNVHHYSRKDLRSVGLSYPEALLVVQARCPGSRASTGFLRCCAHYVRMGEPGYEGCELPQVRPRAAQIACTNSYP
jgi:hypothetical protein